MVAFEIPGKRFSLPAGGDVERYRFVSVNGDSAGIKASADTPVVGVSMNEVKAGQVLEIADGIVMVEAAGAITAGVAVKSDAEGKAVAGEGNAIALTTATGAGSIITVKLN